jgi:hypothetical protein
MTGSFSRRRFLRHAAAACAAPIFVPAAVLGRNGAVPPSEQIALASIGLGFAWDTGLATRDTRLLAVCDVQRQRRDSAVRLVILEANVDPDLRTRLSRHLSSDR